VPCFSDAPPLLESVAGDTLPCARRSDTLDAPSGVKPPVELNVSTTQRYMHLDDAELADVQDLVD